jgi:hypothetical protein
LKSAWIWRGQKFRFFRRKKSRFWCKIFFDLEMLTANSYWFRSLWEPTKLFLGDVGCIWLQHSSMWKLLEFLSSLMPLPWGPEVDAQPNATAGTNSSEGWSLHSEVLANGMLQGPKWISNLELRGAWDTSHSGLLLCQIGNLRPREGERSCLETTQGVRGRIRSILATLPSVTLLNLWNTSVKNKTLGRGTPKFDTQPCLSSQGHDL